MGIGSCILGIAALFAGPIGWLFYISLGLGVLGQSIKAIGYFSNKSNE